MFTQNGNIENRKRKLIAEIVDSCFEMGYGCIRFIENSLSKQIERKLKKHFGVECVILFAIQVHSGYVMFVAQFLILYLILYQFYF